MRWWHWLAWGAGLALLGERIWRRNMVEAFFRRDPPVMRREPRRVTIMQPILSGDPTMPACLERNLQLRSRYPIEWLWLIDNDDVRAQEICAELQTRYPDRAINVLMYPPPPARQNPKLFKLQAALAEADGAVICVLDDDTMLPDGGLEDCLPYLDQPGVGLAFGLPYYVHFANAWSSLTAAFVNTNALLTYIPYTMVTQPFTINGMFYAMRREVLDQIGGFAGLETVLADDFAVAQRVRAHGLRLAQTPVRHPISTHVTNPRHYLSLVQRWFIFPRESLLRHLGPRDRAILGLMGLLPALAPLGLLVGFVVRPSKSLALYTATYYALSFGIAANLNQRYLGGATPRNKLWWYPVIQALFPAQLLVALLSPQRINWRGHIMRVEKGGGFTFERRRTGA